MFPSNLKILDLSFNLEKQNWNNLNLPKTLKTLYLHDTEFKGNINFKGYLSLEKPPYMDDFEI